MTHHCLQIAPRTVGGEEPIKQKHNLLVVLIRRVEERLRVRKLAPTSPNLPENGGLSLSGKAGVTSGNKRKSKLQERQETG